MPTRGFGSRGRRKSSDGRLPPGQSLTSGFPVLTAGPTARVNLEEWHFKIKVGPKAVASWTWEEFNSLPQTRITTDIHCVTTWSKFDTVWSGVTVDDLLIAAGVDLQVLPTRFILAHSVDGYSTNVPVADLTKGKAMVATHYDDQPIPAEHGGPVRLLVPHLYFWKSAKWVNALQFTEKDTAGFWELRGYHMRGDPFKEERYSGD